MKTANIKQVNSAVMILKHFVELSAALLPYFKKLKEKKSISDNEIADLDKINDVFNGYNVDEQTSVLLLNSDIIGLINSSYKAIKNQKSKDDVTVKYYLGRFKKEYYRLRDRWQIIELN